MIEFGEDRGIYQGVLQPRGFPGLPEGWSSEWETFPASDGKLQLFGVHHHATGEQWKDHRALFVVHGLAEHGGRYLHVPHYVKDTVGSVYCLDLRGHGRSEGLRGHVDRWDLFTDDVSLAIQRLNEKLFKRFGKSEIHLLGHSMGGLICARVLFLHPTIALKSATLSAPLLGVKTKVPLYRKGLAALLSRSWSTLQMDTDLDPNDLSHDKEVVRSYENDRLVHKKVTPKLYTEMMGAIADTWRRDTGIEVPLQIVIPLQDRIVNPDTSISFLRALKHRDKQLRTYPEFFHESMNEIGKEKVFEDINSWITAHKGQ